MIQTNINNISGRTLSLQCLRDLAKNDSKMFVHKINEGVASGKIDFENFHDISSLYRALSDIPVSVNITDPTTGIHRAIQTQAFPILTGTAAIKKIQDAYNNEPAIGRKLCTVIQDNKKTTTIGSILTKDKDQDEVKEGEKYPEIGAFEESVTIGHRKQGIKCTVTKETILENDVADIVRRLNAVGKFLIKREEKLILRRVYDYDGSASSAAAPYAYNPGGSGTALYSSTANTPGTRAPSGTRVTTNALANFTNLEAARLVLAAMLDGDGDRIALDWSQVYILVPDALIGVTERIFNSQYVMGVENEISSWGTSGRFFIPRERILSSTRLDDLSTTCWHMGAFKEQFHLKEKIAMNYVTLGSNTQAYLDADIAFQARGSFDIEVGAIDYVFCVQNLAASTAPKDE